MTSSLIYLQIPKERLGVLQDLDLEKLYVLRKKFKQDWIKNKRCICVDSLEEGTSLNCIHITKEIKNKFKEIEEKINKRAIASIYQDLFVY